MQSRCAAFWVALTAAFAGESSPGVEAAAGQDPIPFVATRSDTVRDMLWIAGVGKEDVVYDLGSGDGRVVIAAARDFGAGHAVGVENNPELVRESRENARRAGVAARVEFREGDLFEAQFSDASVVTLFLGHGPNLRLRPKLVGGLSPGTRVVSHQFGMGEWRPDKELTVRTEYLGMRSTMYNPYRDNPRVPDFTANDSHFGNDRIMMWVVPAPVAGVWRGTVEAPGGPRECRLTLHQSLSGVHGTLRLDGEDGAAEDLQVDLWGDHVRWWRPGGAHPVRFDGHADGDTMRGTILVAGADGPSQARPWTARRVTADMTGTWEWPCATGDRPDPSDYASSGAAAAWLRPILIGTARPRSPTSTTSGEGFTLRF